MYLDKLDRMTKELITRLFFLYRPAYQALRQLLTLGLDVRAGMKAAA